MKVLLIYPNIGRHGDIPIALTVLASVLKAGGHLVDIFDFSHYIPEVTFQSIQEDYGMFKRPAAPPVAAPIYRSIDNLEKDLADFIKKSNVDIVGITANSGTYRLGLKCGKFIKKHYREIFMLFGGIHSTLCPDEVIAEDCIDAICIGEGEDAFLELCDTIEVKKDIYSIKNLWIRDKNNPEIIHKNPLRPLKDLNTLPLQDFSGFNEYEFYRALDGKMYKMLNTEISRGCPFECSYCSNKVLRDGFKGLGNYQRRKNPEIAVKHLKELKEKYQFEIIRFWDEDFTVFPVAYIKELAALYKKEVNLPFIVYAGTRTITEEKIEYLKKMGCVTIAMAIESGNYWIRKYILNRNISDEDIIEKYELVKKSGIRVSAYNMIGLPFETRKMVFDTIYLNRKVNAATSSVSAYIPYPKTRLAEITKEFGLLKESQSYESLYTSLKSPHLDEDEINGLIKTFSLYVKLPENFFPILERCEKDELFAKETFPALLKFLQDENK